MTETVINLALSHNCCGITDVFLKMKKCSSFFIWYLDFIQNISLV